MISYNAPAFIYKNTGYDVKKDFVPVVELTKAPSVLITHPRSPYRSVKDLVNAAQQTSSRHEYRVFCVILDHAINVFMKERLQMIADYRLSFI